MKKFKTDIKIKLQNGFYIANGIHTSSSKVTISEHVFKKIDLNYIENRVQEELWNLYYKDCSPELCAKLKELVCLVEKGCISGDYIECQKNIDKIIEKLIKKFGKIARLDNG